MKFAYADPPYLGCAVRLYGDHPDAAVYDTIEGHAALIGRLVDEFPDGWAYSLIDQLEASFSETCEWRGRKWSVADMQRDESEYGVHWHLTLVPAREAAQQPTGDES